MIVSKVTRLICAGAVLVDGKPLKIQPRPEDVTDVLRPLLCDLHGCEHDGARGLIGIVGPPGVGKSVFLGWLTATARALGFSEFAFISLDGYHLPNAELVKRTGAGPDGEPIALRQLKGAPESFNAEALLADLRVLRSRRDATALPAYSRKLHDPVPGAIRIGPEVEWVFVEGNFLFLDAPLWREVRALFDRRIFLDADDAILRAHLAARHAAAGRDASWIEAHFRRVDGPNIARVRASARHADLLLRWTPDRWLRRTE